MQPEINIRLARPSLGARELWFKRLDSALAGYGRGLTVVNRPRAAALYAQLETPQDAAAKIAAEDWRLTR